MAAIKPDGRMDFKLVHERRSPGAYLSEEEIASYRRQENRWANDFREIIRRLTREGFSYQIQMEDFFHTDSIPVVVVETAEELNAEEEDLDYADKKYRSSEFDS